MNKDIKKFVDDALKTMDLNLSIEKREKMYYEADNYVNNAILKKIPEGAQAELDEIAKQGNEAELREFCEKHIPELKNIVANALTEFAKAVFRGLKMEK